MDIKALLNDLWLQYCHDTPKVKQIHDWFLEKEGEVINDHIALRTFNDPRVNIDILSKPFLEAGFVEGGEYTFPVKKLFAKHFEHKDASYPRIFISELHTEKFSQGLQTQATKIVDAIPESLLNDVPTLLTSGVSWAPIQHEIYQQLLSESEYAAWLYAFGFRANHFTVSVNHLKSLPTIQAVNDFLTQKGIALNTSGGAVKGTPDDLLEQSSTKAFPVDVNFEEGRFEIPLAYYEFALRYPKPDGELYGGFVAASADKIFESTDSKR